MHKPMEEGGETLITRASTAGQQARKVPSMPSHWDNWGNPLLMALQARTTHRCPSLTPLGTTCIATGRQAEELETRLVPVAEWVHLETSLQPEGVKFSTSSTTYLLGFSSQREQLRALSLSLPQPREALSLSHDTGEETGA